MADGLAIGGGILSLLGGLAVGYRKNQLAREAEQLKNSRELLEKDVIGPAIESGRPEVFDLYAKTLQQHFPKQDLAIMRSHAETNTQAQKMQRMIEMLHGLMNPGGTDQSGQPAQPSQPAQNTSALGNPTDTTNLQPTSTGAMPVGRPVTEMNVTGQPTNMDIRPLLSLNQRQQAADAMAQQQQQAQVQPTTPTPTPTPTPAPKSQSPKDLMNAMGLQPEISTDAKGNVTIRTVPKQKLSSDEMKANAMATIAQNAAPNDPVGQAKSFLAQSIDLIRAGHIPNSLEANTAYAITESAHQAFPDDVQARSKYIVAASQAAKQYQEQNDPKLKLDQNRYDLSVQQFNRELNNDKENIRAKAEARLDTEINQIEQRLAQNQNLMLKAEPGMIDAIKTTVGMKSNKYKAAGEIQTNISRDQEQLTRLQQLRAGYQQSKNPTPAPGTTTTPVPVPPGKMRIRNDVTGNTELYPTMPVAPRGYSKDP